MKGCDWPMDAATLVVASCCQFILLQATLPESPPERQGTCINIATGLLSSFSRHCADSGSNLVRIELFRGCWTLALQLMWSSSALSQPHHQSILTRILPLLCTLLPPFPDGHCDAPHTVMFLLDTVQRLATISKPIFGVDEVAAFVTRVCSSSSFCFDLFVRGSLACISNCDGTPSSLATSKALVPVLAACLVSPSVPSAANVIAQGVLEALSHLAGPFHMTRVRM